MANDKKSVSTTIFWISIRTVVNLFAIFLLVEGFVEGYYFSYKVFGDYPYQAAATNVQSVTIEENANVQQVALVLDEMGIVDGKYVFMARAYLGGYYDDLKPGVYQLGPGMTPDEICKKICGKQSEEQT